MNDVTKGTRFPLREQRKARTREALIRSARELFGRRGYEQATLEEVAENAGLHVQTLYRHFANKQELATAAEEDGLAAFEAAIQNPSRSNNTFEFWRDWVERASKALTQDDGGKQYREFLRHIWSPATVSTQLIRIGHRYEDLLAQSLAHDFGSSEEDLGAARLAAVTLWGAHAYVIRQHATRESYDLVVEATAAVDAVQAHYGHLIVNTNLSQQAVHPRAT